MDPHLVGVGGRGVMFNETDGLSGTDCMAVVSRFALRAGTR
jgi:hypothetical protein